MAKRTKHRGPAAPAKYLDQSQIERFLAFVSREAAQARANGSRRAVMDEMLVTFMLHTALRADEVCHVQVRDCPHFHGKAVLYCRRGKGNVTRTIQVSDRLGEELQRYCKTYRRNARPNSPLFASESGYRKLCWQVRRKAKTDGRILIEDRAEWTSRLSYHALYQRIRGLGERSGIGRLYPHMLRHSALSLLYTIERDIEFIRVQAGHRSLATTQRYVHVATDAQRRQVRAFDMALNCANPS